MTIASKDFVRLRWSLLLFIVLVLLGGAAVFATRHLAEQEAKTNQQVLAQRDDIQARLARANEETAEIRQKIGRYQEIEARGHLGQEHRLEWVERIAQIKNARRLIDIQYELSPQKPVDAALLPNGGTAGGYEFMASTMKLQIQLLHEDDLLGFLNDLNGSVQAFLHVRGCHVERAAKSGAERGIAAQLKAECTIDWITLREKK
ncbi:MAG: hypothetical protein A2045_07665 [Rhodocyclales bacterium GWA2_65_20]|nr:MAG: hypothetical protein A2045_07665 [Rhodocyclales bacterium GWA2_65_20]